MLLITRRTGESVVINGMIEMTVVEVRGGRVKVGFEYPQGNTVYRKELFVKIQEENRHAVSSLGGNLGNILKNLNKKEDEEK
jgi:carbon storage regulator